MCCSYHCSDTLRRQRLWPQDDLLIASFKFENFIPTSAAPGTFDMKVSLRISKIANRLRRQFSRKSSKDARISRSLSLRVLLMDLKVPEMSQGGLYMNFDN